jgi:hypothetical protein
MTPFELLHYTQARTSESTSAAALKFVPAKCLSNIENHGWWSNRLFSETANPSARRLVRSQVSTTGVVMSAYVSGGDIRSGSFASAEPSERELARRKMMVNGMW